MSRPATGVSPAAPRCSIVYGHRHDCAANERPSFLQTPFEEKGFAMTSRRLKEEFLLGRSLELELTVAGRFPITRAGTDIRKHKSRTCVASRFSTHSGFNATATTPKCD